MDAPGRSDIDGNGRDATKDRSADGEGVERKLKETVYLGNNSRQSQGKR